ncbi:MAG TPA: hypothetical protein VLT15_13995 [Acidimicrobiia bacterium]|nr:hypothetical protein [Acidimicrobiia bacterium]
MAVARESVPLTAYSQLIDGLDRDAVHRLDEVWVGALPAQATD